MSGDNKRRITERTEGLCIRTFLHIFISRLLWFSQSGIPSVLFLKTLIMSVAYKKLINNISNELADYVASHNITDVEQLKVIVRLKIEEGIEEALTAAYNEVLLKRDMGIKKKGFGTPQMEKRASMFRTLISEMQTEKNYSKLKHFLKEKAPEMLEEFFGTVEDSSPMKRKALPQE